jgi:hypothetical protein
MDERGADHGVGGEVEFVDAFGAWEAGDPDDLRSALRYARLCLCQVPGEHSVELYIGTSGGTVSVYDPAASGDTLPKRDIDGELPPFLRAVALDSDRNLYVAVALNTISVFAADAKGHVAPIREITDLETFHDRDVTSAALDTADNLYVLATSHGDGIVAVYPPGTNGEATPTRVISGLQVSEGSLQCIAIDSHDYLYLANGANQFPPSPVEAGAIRVYLPGAYGSPQPVRRIEGGNTSLGYASAMDFDADNNLYVANGSNVLVFKAGADGNQAPTRIIGGSATGLSADFALAVEPSGVVYSGRHVGYPPYVSVFAAGANGNVSPIRTITHSQAAAMSMALDKPTTTVAKASEEGDSDVGDPREHSLNITLQGYFDRPIGNLIVGGSGWILQPGKPPIPVPPPGGWGQIDADTSDALTALVLNELARNMTDAPTRQQMRTELLDSVQASLGRLRGSVAANQTARLATPARRKGTVAFLARLLRLRAKSR